MTRLTLRQLAVSLAAALVVVSMLSAGAGVAAAQSDSDDDGLLEELFGSDNSSDDGMLSFDSAVTLWQSYQGSATGAWERVKHWGDEADATLAADDVQHFVNSHNESIEQYINARTTASSDFDVIAVEFRDDSGSDTRYIVSDVVDGNYTNGRMVASTERSVDETCELEDQAVANARDELDTVYTDYVNTSSDLGTEQLAALNSQYQPDVACSFFLP